MVDFSAWKDKSLAVTELQLDAKNPRIPEIRDDPAQPDIVTELVRHDDVYELARDIAEQGYFPNEFLIAVKEGENTVVVEGNRRLAALKCLISPELAPDEYVNRFRQLQPRVNLAAIKKIRVQIAPSREVAAPIIIARHTRTGVARWESAQQAKFIANLVGPGDSIDDVAKQYGLSRADVLSALRIHTMYQIACTLELPDDKLRLVRDPRHFNTSTLDRLIHSSKGPEFLGLTFDDVGGFTGNLHPEEFKKGYKRIISDIASGTVSSRNLNTTKEIDEYLSGVGKDAPNTKVRGSFTSASLLGATQKVAIPEPKIAKKTSGQKLSPSIIPKGFRCFLSLPRISDIYRELKGIRVDGHENTVAVMLRIFLELSVNNYLEKTGKIRPLLEAADRKNRPKDWNPPLRQMLRLLLADSDVLGSVPRSAIKALNKAVSDDDHPLSLDSMDQFVHNRFAAPTERQLRNLWAQFEDLLKLLMVEPIPPATETK